MAPVPGVWAWTAKAKHSRTAKIAGSLKNCISQAPPLEASMNDGAPAARADRSLEHAKVSPGLFVLTLDEEEDVGRSGGRGPRSRQRRLAALEGCRIGAIPGQRARGLGRHRTRDQHGGLAAELGRGEPLPEARRRLRHHLAEPATAARALDPGHDSGTARKGRLARRGGPAGDGGSALPSWRGPGGGTARAPENGPLGPRPRTPQE